MRPTVVDVEEPPISHLFDLPARGHGSKLLLCGVGMLPGGGLGSVVHVVQSSLWSSPLLPAFRQTGVLQYTTDIEVQSL